MIVLGKITRYFSLLFFLLKFSISSFLVVATFFYTLFPSFLVVHLLARLVEIFVPLGSPFAIS